MAGAFFCKDVAVHYLEKGADINENGKLKTAEELTITAGALKYRSRMSLVDRKIFIPIIYKEIGLKRQHLIPSRYRGNQQRILVNDFYCSTALCMMEVQRSLRILSV